MGLLPLTYRRPEFIPKPDEVRPSSRATTNSTDSGSSSGIDEKAGTSVKSGQSGMSRGIPSALSFDKIIEGGTCPPCTVRDFMNYLIYVERAAENLQFFLWLRDYKTRFEAASTSDIALAPEWTQAKEDELTVKLQKEHTEKMRKEPAAATQIFKGTDFDKNAAAAAAERNESDWGASQSGDGESTIIGSQSTNYKAQAQEAFTAAGAKQPFTIQPFREEIDRVIANYIVEDSPRQLNLASRERDVLVHALAYTTHPSAFRSVARTVEHSLRRQAHPNFIRWSICNGNPARVFFARALGVSLIVIGLTASIVLALSSAGRGYRALGAIGWMLGVSTLVAAYKGMCVVLHGMHHRHVRPWELFETDERDVEVVGEDGGRMSKGSFDSFGSGNSYEDEPWVVKYKKRNIVRKIFDREVWIQEPALRQIQDTIFVQAMLAALLASGLLVLIFVLVPGGDFF
ncbi:hypothetical protein MCOR27_005773 [Pyricularia oryzae]|uniref:Regulator of G protein signaling superfamily n=1 Tax=Pyricularia grisea TaxID=148305 RepID=A0ABQ8P0P7_PYRGI|nr:hypothetical protein MCOR01_009730 [Pyricularia oryzae]KAI6304313.1 hypothetical protein MCOR33_000624 [Pyricularia grisea]KAH9436982.1 hypothetical protein MCOR02_000644 [Pyricularia oryzae]KAI6260030.1 hypothetical protein MCOR19_003646 [Pyricularia oryzae]KAI6278021.1 hypothetical protein MCOR27_005773 [Pyricularia oryzae]